MPDGSDGPPEAITHWLGGNDDDRNLNKTISSTARELLADYYVEQTAKTVAAYANESFFNVALQFPDHLLHLAPFICESLQYYTDVFKKHEGNEPRNETITTFFVLGDTSYGECCVDEVAAQHLSSNLIVHYGNACLTPTRKLPALFVFPKYYFADSNRACTIFRDSIQQILDTPGIQKIVILYDLEIGSCFFGDRFQSRDKFVSFSSLSSDKEIQVARKRLPDLHDIVLPGINSSRVDPERDTVGPHSFQRGDIPLAETAFIWYSHRNRKQDEDYHPALRSAALQLSTVDSDSCSNFYSISLLESNSQFALINASKILSRRLAAMRKVKDSERIGIIPGTLGASGNIEIMERCKAIINKSGKHSYIILVGKPSPEKLANYPEIDLFVLVACPQHGFLNTKDYLRPIITPYELEAAILRDGDIFSSPYTVDFQELLERKLSMDMDASEDSQLMDRGDWTIAVSGTGGGADYLKRREWQGLKYEEGGSDDQTGIKDIPTHIIPGESGISTSYSRERFRVPEGEE